jgi:hypothetical protein
MADNQTAATNTGRVVIPPRPPSQAAVANATVTANNAPPTQRAGFVSPSSRSISSTAAAATAPNTTVTPPPQPQPSVVDMTNDPDDETKEDEEAMSKLKMQKAREWEVVKTTKFASGKSAVYQHIHKVSIDQAKVRQ